VVKNNILYIFIYVLLIGCNIPNSAEPCIDDCYLDITAPYLEMDENGYYHIERNDNHIQTFVTIEAVTGTIDDYDIVHWVTNQENHVVYWEDDYHTSLINPTSYTNLWGKAYAILGITEQFDGDTIQVYSLFTGDCNIQHIDSLEVVVD
jgi:hypothetical protein